MQRHFTAAAFATYLLAVSSLVGCASTGADKVDQTSDRLTTFGATIETLQVDVKDAAAALSQVVETGKTDPKPAFKDFSAKADRVAASAKKARSNYDRAQGEGNKLFDTWTKRLDSITDPDIRKASEKRRDELKKTLDEVVAKADPSLTDLEAYVVATQDLRTYLAQDLTPSGIDAISGKSKALTKSAGSLAKDLEGVLKAAKKAAPQFATAKAPPAAK